MIVGELVEDLQHMLLLQGVHGLARKRSAACARAMGAGVVGDGPGGRAGSRVGMVGVRVFTAAVEFVIFTRWFYTVYTRCVPYNYTPGTGMVQCITVREYSYIIMAIRYE